ncbi:hypothetical protein QE152_g3750 [Popillia japonica]|uniref:Zinc finger GRF-type domain-containing protein n=1 Tax=Popillia japonica TaxID=7064 RepID=A0AAW1N2F8_POPJA
MVTCENFRQYMKNRQQFWEHDSQKGSGRQYYRCESKKNSLQLQQQPNPDHERPAQREKHCESAQPGEK